MADGKVGGERGNYVSPRRAGCAGLGLLDGLIAAGPGPLDSASLVVVLVLGAAATTAAGAAGAAEDWYCSRQFSRADMPPRNDVREGLARDEFGLKRRELLRRTADGPGLGPEDWGWSLGWELAKLREGPEGTSEQAGEQGRLAWVWVLSLAAAHSM
ncbi:hypothetical protein F5B22DRAFT_645921 [Xylaria bambusicola]|uniref:uncharacterized protein n=1 Tax=Xylaria bambusicola TaxID=326684 RepID=UPI002008D614|nr:uncharacterized protein F5B22DRAFT_645921 [Xylaria bambusicola]KAI0517288.1 hypothetical protein F5B22DRAFT_645921 [Xylaria bambusicola]